MRGKGNKDGPISLPARNRPVRSALRNRIPYLTPHPCLVTVRREVEWNSSEHSGVDV